MAYPEVSNSKRWLRIPSIYNLQHRTVNLWRNDRAKGSGFRLMHRKLWEGRYMG